MIADNFIYWLENKNFGTVGTNLFDNFQPANPDNCITAFDVSAPGVVESSSLKIDMFGLQVLVRNLNSADAKNIIKMIHKKFIGFGGESLIPNGDILSMTSIGSPIQCLGKDEKNRTEWTVTYNLRVQSSNDSYRL